MTRWGGSEAEAGARLMVAVRDRAGCRDREISSTSRLVSAAPAWLDEMAGIANKLDKVYEDKPLEELAGAPVEALQGVSDGDAETP